MTPNTETEIMHERLQAYLSQEREEALISAMRRLIEDPLRPRTKHHHFRPNPMLLLLFLLAVFGIATFLYFSFGGV